MTLISLASAFQTVTVKRPAEAAQRAEPGFRPSLSDLKPLRLFILTAQRLHDRHLPLAEHLQTSSLVSLPPLPAYHSLFSAT